VYTYIYILYIQEQIDDINREHTNCMLASVRTPPLLHVELGAGVCLLGSCWPDWLGVCCVACICWGFVALPAFAGVLLSVLLKY